MSAAAAADAFAAATAHWLRASSWVAIGEKAMQRDLRAVQKGCPSSSPRIRLGPSGDGGWTVCDTAALRAPECAVLSVGVGTDWRFDAATARHYNCSVVMLDPTPAVVEKMRADRKQKQSRQEDPHTLFASLPNLRFEPWGLAERDEKLVMNNWWTKYKATDPREMLTLSTIRRRIGGAAVAFLATAAAGVAALLRTAAPMVVRDRLARRSAATGRLAEAATAARAGKRRLWVLPLRGDDQR